MYVKIIRYPNGEDQKYVEESLTHCSNIFVSYEEEESGELKNVKVLLADLSSKYLPECTYSMELTRIYVMNDSGKTIDNYVWKKDDERKKFIRM